MTQLALSALFFTALHLLVSGTLLRDAMVSRLGERGFRGAFSLASAAGLAWLIWAYVRLSQPAPTALFEYRWAAAVLVFIAFVFIVSGLMTPGPTLVGGEKLLERDDAARGIHRITRHPFLWGTALWAAVHIVFNPGPAQVLFFGTFLVVAVAGAFSIDAKRARLFGEPWRRYALSTSNIPFAAIARKRNRLALAELGIVKLAVTVVAYAAFVLTHARFFGVAPF